MLLPRWFNFIAIGQRKNTQKVSSVFWRHLLACSQVHAQASGAGNQIFNRDHPHCDATERNWNCTVHDIAVSAKNVHANRCLRIDALQQGPGWRVAWVYVAKQQIHAEGPGDLIERIHQKVNVVEWP